MLALAIVEYGFCARGGITIWVWLWRLFAVPLGRYVCRAAIPLGDRVEV